MAQSQPQPSKQAPSSNSQKPDPEAVPERPKLAPNVELGGEMQESGFEDQQWLVQRNGSFVQLTELLYRVVEQLDGKRTLEEIAEGVSQATGRGVSADNVRQLIGSKLIPLGLVVKADGSVAQGAGDGQGAARSPLAVNMRMKMLSPRLIEPITAVLQYLYKPILLIPILLIAAAAHIWLYFVHGIGRGAHDLLYAPGLLLIILGIITASAAFHEFGHAAALRYGGGKVGGMGAGIYLVYPAFYTDVTDNYRLGRWDRLRTDLGGFYFNLIFELAMIGLYFLTGYEFLLIAVLLLDLEIVHQLLPFVRLDGYWALADLTGIPDFFSHIGPFLRTVLPLPWWKGRTLPNMKTWVKAVFAIYILVTIPLLLFLLFVMVKGVPRVLATAWDSFLKQRETFVAAQGSGDALGMAASAVQIATLALPTFGILFLLFNLGRRLFSALWRWGSISPLRRVAASLATAGIVGLLVLLWAPSLPFTGAPGPLYTYTSARFQPIQPEERGTVGEAVSDLPVAFPAIFDGAQLPPTAGPTAVGTPAPTGEPTEAPLVAPTELTAEPTEATATATPRPAATQEPPPTNTPAPQEPPPTNTPAPQEPPPTNTPAPQEPPPTETPAPQEPTSAPTEPPQTPTATPTP